MDKHFHPSLGETAWPDGCPCCRERVRMYEPENDVTYAWWSFLCGCEIVLDDGHISVEEDCPDAMDQHLEGIVTHV